MRYSSLLLRVGRQRVSGVYMHGRQPLFDLSADLDQEIPQPVAVRLAGEEQVSRVPTQLSNVLARYVPPEVLLFRRVGLRLIHGYRTNVQH